MKATKKMLLRAGVFAGLILLRSVELDVAGFDRQLSPGRHRVARVDDQIHDHELDLVRIDADQPEALTRHDRKLDVFSDHAHQHAIQIAEQLIQVQHLGLED